VAVRTDLDADGTAALLGRICCQDVDDTSLRIQAEQCSLRSPQHFDLADIAERLVEDPHGQRHAIGACRKFS
jgi:hypothetical protein